MSHAQNVVGEMDDEIAFLLAKSLKLVTSGSIRLHASNKPALKIQVTNDSDKDKKININFMEPEFFNIDIVEDVEI